MGVTQRLPGSSAPSKHDPKRCPDRETLRAEPGEPGYIYFIQMGKDGPIKIGWAREPQARLTGLQTGSPVALVLLAVLDGDRGDERRLHDRLGAYRLRGEWFKDCADVRRAMEGATYFRGRRPTTNQGEHCLNCEALLVVDEDTLCKACIEFMDDWATPEFAAHWRRANVLAR